MRKATLVRSAGRIGAGLAMLAPFAAFAQTAAAASTDPTTGIVTTLTTYGTDVGLLATAVLLIFYGKKLVSYLKV